MLRGAEKTLGLRLTRVWAMKAPQRCRYVFRVTLYRRRSSRVRVHGNFGQRENYETREYCESPRKDDI